MNRFTAALMILVMGVFYMTERAYPAGGDRDIFRYASEGNIPQIKISVEKGDRPDALDSCGRRPADLALQAGRKDAVEFLQSLKILTYPSGSLYIGQMKNGMEHGWGVYRCFNGSLYSGEFDNGRFQGLGQWRYAMAPGTPAASSGTSSRAGTCTLLTAMSIQKTFTVKRFSIARPRREI
jgi:hypothetical protein